VIEDSYYSAVSIQFYRIPQNTYLRILDEHFDLFDPSVALDDISPLARRVSKKVTRG